MLLLCLCLEGCATYYGIPQEPIELAKVNEKLKADLLTAIENRNTVSILKEDRNDLINKTVTLIDLNYAKFVNDIGRQRRTKDTIVDITELSLNIAAAAVGSAATKTVLSAISAGVTGSNTAIDTNFFYDLALPSLIAQMNADRTEVYLRIVSGMTQETTGEKAYLWAQALRDLVDYYNAGTLQHAAFSIIKEAGAKQQKDEIQIKDLIVISQKADDLSVKTQQRLNDSLNNITAKNIKDVKEILIPLSRDLADLPNCKTLESVTTGTEQQIKGALNACIQNVSSSKKPLREVQAKIQQRFKEAHILSE